MKQAVLSDLGKPETNILDLRFYNSSDHRKDRKVRRGYDKEKEITLSTIHNFFLFLRVLGALYGELLPIFKSKIVNRNFIPITKIYL